MTPVVVPTVTGPSGPTVTIVMVTYGQWALCRRSLEAVVDHTEPVYQVVVVDNASPDDTAERLRREVVGATLIFNDENHGFGAAANQGAQHAVGRHLCFLNSDAFVTSGWLSPMLELLDEDPGVAAVCPRFLNMDGTLQEAGYLVDRLAVTRALGYGDDPEQPQYRFGRTLDYGSGACLLVRRRDFTAVGGFDPVYGQGYYEDVDLGLALAARSRRIAYQPRSTVRHVLGGSSEFGQSTMERVNKNRFTFRARWWDALDSRPCLESVEQYPHRLIATRDSTSVDRVLVIGEPSDRTGSLAASIAPQWPTSRVTLLHEKAPPSAASVPSLLAAGVELVRSDDDVEAWLDARRFHYSVVLLGPENHGRFSSPLARTQPQAMRLLDLRGGTQKELSGDPRAGDTDAVRAADVVLCASEQDRRFVAEVARDTPALLFPPVPGTDALVDAMSHVGVAPPMTRLERRMAGSPSTGGVTWGRGPRRVLT
jgi:GT2 family glycosyltransferase